MLQEIGPIHFFYFFGFTMSTCSTSRKSKSWFCVFLINISLLPGGGEVLWSSRTEVNVHIKTKNMYYRSNFPRLIESINLRCDYLNRVMITCDDYSSFSNQINGLLHVFHYACWHFGIDAYDFPTAVSVIFLHSYSINEAKKYLKYLRQIHLTLQPIKVHLENVVTL